MNRIAVVFSLLLGWSLMFPVLALSPPETPLSGEQQQRYRALIQELRCLVCQNQSIADSNADLALDLRAQVHQRIVAGESDAEIRRYVTDRYGEFVLYKPPMNMRNLLLWAGPFLLLIIGATLVFRRLSRPANYGESKPVVNREQLRKLLEEDQP
tara:strand:- start:26324 stop:26788 length:465 start_codon:yes stop_codon:yes gene_type:complete